MGKFEEAVRTEINRLTRRQVRAVQGPLAREIRELKRSLALLNKSVALLQKTAAQSLSHARPAGAGLAVPEAEVKTSRISPRLIKKLRKRLKLSQDELAKILGVSSVSVWSWESGRTKPGNSKKNMLVGLRKIGRREVKKILGSVTGAGAESSSAIETAPRKRGRPRKNAAK